MREATVRELWTYPVKSCQGVAAEAVELSRMGVAGDRRFAVWADGKLVEQKLTPAMASIGAEFDDSSGVLTLRHHEQGSIEHELRPEGEIREATWVLDEFETVDQGDEAARWLSVVLGRDVRLVIPHGEWEINFPIPQMELLHRRPKRSFTAASPVGLANWASLEDLNTRVNTPVPMDRFRVNVVVDGLEPYEEDDLTSLANDEVELIQVTSAERCAIITTDQQTGERPDNNLMQTLAAYRAKPKEERFASGLKFGNYMTVGREGTLRVGDRLLLA